MIATASCRALHRFELHHQARLQRSNPHRACRISPAHHARFPPLEAFGRRPPECAAPSIMRPASETLHSSGLENRHVSNVPKLEVWRKKEISFSVRVLHAHRYLPKRLEED